MSPRLHDGLEDSTAILFRKMFSEVFCTKFLSPKSKGHQNNRHDHYQSKIMYQRIHYIYYSQMLVTLHYQQQQFGNGRAIYNNIFLQK